MEKNSMGEEDIRVIKISKEALFEFIYEKFIEGKETYFDVASLEVMDSFDIDWETGQFIFCVHKAEDANGKIIPFPQEINLQQLLKKIPDTTSSMFSGNRYRVYTKDDLIELSKK